MTPAHVRRFATAASVLLALASLGAQTGAKKVLTLDDYPRWSAVLSTALSADGRWMSYGYRPNDGDETLYVRELGSEKLHRIAGGADPSFSDDGRFFAALVSLPKKEADKLRKEKKPVQRAAVVLNLATGDEWRVDGAAAIRFSPDGKVVAVQREKPQDQKFDGTDLVLRELETGLVRNIGNVSEYAFDKSGTWLASLIAAADQGGNSVQVMDLRTGSLRVLDSAKADYARLAWSASGTALAVLRGNKPAKQTKRENVLLTWADISQPTPQRTDYDPVEDPAFPKGGVLSELSPLEWSEDRARVFLGVKEQEAEAPKSDDPVANVDVWHWKDERVQSVQMVRADADRRATWRSDFTVATHTFLQLASEPMPTVTIAGKGRQLIGRFDKPYRLEIAWSGGRADYVAIDPATGTKTTIVTGLERQVGTSPNGRYFVYLRNAEVFAWDATTGQTANISKVAKTSFVDKDDDHPYEKPTYGVAGWSADGKSILLNHKFDVWSVALDGSAARNLTGGTGDAQQIVFRVLNLDPDADTIDLTKPVLLTAYGEWTKKAGFYRLQPTGALETLAFDDARYGRPQKAKRADVVLFTKETFEAFPDMWTSDTAFSNPKRVTDANPQQAEYRWGRRVLVDYTNAEGVKLQATLTLPADYEPGKQYPMLVYFYEKLSQNHHAYSMPVYDDRPHMSTYASGGYLVLMPDVVYEIGRPGFSALDCVTSAVKKVIDLGYADPKHIGLQGHSWGGFESSFILTQTDMFAAVVTGAPPTDLISFYDTLYRSTGTVQQGITEIGQVRMGTTPWQNLDLFLSQSAVVQAPKIKTPFLILHGTADGAVDYGQGLEYYNAARRLGKEVILLSYPGEDHHLTKTENQKDFQVRMRQFFDHYLKGTPAPEWMTDGVPFLKKKGG